MCSGNHDDFTKQISGVDVVGMLARQNKIAFAPHEVQLTVGVKDREYAIAVRHQYRYNSSFNQTHTVKQWLRMGEDDFDIGCIGHHHEAAVEGFMYKGKRRWACRPGSYQVSTSYTSQYGFNRATATCPTFLLYGDDREISGFFDLHDAVDFISS
jgi:predicted phosphodiesterase